MSLHQAIAWIEEKEARILRVGKGLHHESTIVAPNSQDMPRQLASNDGATTEENGFFHQVARALDTADEILIVGPATARISSSRGALARFS